VAKDLISGYNDMFARIHRNAIDNKAWSKHTDGPESSARMTSIPPFVPDIGCPETAFKYVDGGSRASSNGGVFDIDRITIPDRREEETSTAIHLPMDGA
jgi:hypothetical protein